MDFGRPDHNELFGGHTGEEPAIVILGSDRVGHLAARAYAYISRLNGGSDNLYEMVMKQAHLMEDYLSKMERNKP